MVKFTKLVQPVKASFSMILMDFGSSIVFNLLPMINISPSWGSGTYVKAQDLIISHLSSYRNNLDNKTSLFSPRLEIAFQPILSVFVYCSFSLKSYLDAKSSRIKKITDSSLKFCKNFCFITSNPETLAESIINLVLCKMNIFYVILRCKRFRCYRHIHCQRHR